jgi:manganese-dependent inorganic pyrophosphatase
MYNAKLDITVLSPEAIVTNDLKAFEFGKMRVGISQIEVADKGPILARKADILAAMSAYQEKKNFDLMLLMVSDVLLEGSELLVVGYTRFVEKAFGVSLTEQAVFLPGVLSRKKQVVPPLSNAV